MNDIQKTTAEQYHETAEEIRSVARRMRFPDIRVQLLDLAERYERLATRVGRGVSVGPWRTVTFQLRDTTLRAASIVGRTYLSSIPATRAPTATLIYPSLTSPRP